MFHAVWYTSIFLPVLVLARLTRLRIQEPHWMGFAAMLLFGLVRDLTLLVVPYNTKAYGYCWLATLPFLLLAQSLATLGCYISIARQYAKIGRFAVWLFAGCLTLSAAGCVALTPVELVKMDEASLRLAFLLQRVVTSILAGSLLLVVLFFTRFPRPAKQVSTNLQLHVRLIAAYFGVAVIECFAANLLPLPRAKEVSLIAMACACVFYLAWALKLKPSGEAVTPWPKLDPGVVDLIERRNQQAVALTEDLARSAFGR